MPGPLAAASAQTHRMQASDLFADPQVQFAFWIGIVSMALTLGIILQVVWIRLGRAIARRQARAFSAVWPPLVVQVISGEPLIAPPLLKNHERWQFLLLWVHYQESLRGPIKGALNQLFEQVGMPAYVQALLRKGSVDAQLIAMTALGHWGQAACWQDLLDRLADESPVLSMTAARALLLIDPSRATEPVLSAIVERRDWPPARLGLMLREASADFADAFIALLDGAASENRAYLPRLIRLFETLNHNFVPESLKHIVATSTEASLVSMCLRLIKDPEDLPLVRSRLHDPSWQVQVHAVAVIGHIGTPQDLPLLQALLSSREWWVRYRAAQAMLALPFMTHDAGMALLPQLQDPYARDILTQVLAETKNAP